MIAIFFVASIFVNSLWFSSVIWDKLLSVLFTKYAARLLEDDDANATEVVDELLEMPGAESHRTMLKQLAKAVGEYDFDRALEELASLESVCKKTTNNSMRLSGYTG